MIFSRSGTLKLKNKFFQHTLYRYYFYPKHYSRKKPNEEKVKDRN
jgi:hypothetical protein